MNAMRFMEAMNKVNSRYIMEALQIRKTRTKMRGWVRWGCAAACLCLILAAGFLGAVRDQEVGLNPSYVEISSPILSMQTLEEMEEYMGFSVPVLDKAVDGYCVYVMAGEPAMGQVNYADGSEFRIQCGQGDISGIQGGAVEQTTVLAGVQVRLCRLEDMTYALWEAEGFTFSYVYTDNGIAEVETLIQQLG